MWKGVFIMLERLIITLIFATGFLLVCWTLMEYWLRSSRRTTETGLRDKTILVIGRFCQAIQQKKNFRHIWMEEEFGSAHLNPLHSTKNTAEADEHTEGREQGSRYHEKKFKMKINM